MQTTDPYLIYVGVFTITSLVLLLVGLLFMYLRTVSKFAEFKREEVKRFEEPEKLLREAQANSQKMIEEAQGVLTNAHKESSMTIAKASEYLNSHQEDIKTSLDSASQEYLAKYSQALTLIQNDTIKLLQNIPKDASNILSTEIQKVRMVIESKTTQAQNDARNLIIEAYKKAETEVQEYKSVRLKQIEESLVYILENIAKRVLIKEISQDEHEKLVLKALEEAKRQGIFSSTQDFSQAKKPENTG